MFKKILATLVSGLSLFAGQGQIVQTNEIDIWYETFGNKQDPALLLIMGGCCQGVLWDKGFCERLASEGFYVIRYDHRDTGLSSSIDFEKNPYDLMDMTKDAVGVLDAAGVEKAHIFGVSLGGFLSEILAAYYPERVHTITILGSSCDIHPMNLAYAGLPMDEKWTFSPPTPQYLEWMKGFLAIPPQTEDEKLAQRLEGWNMLNGQVFPLNEEINREIHTEFLARFRYPEGIINHVTMLRAESSENLVLTTPSKIKVPTIIIQGSEDPIFPPDHGEALSLAIEGSEYFYIKGMGHIPSDHFYDFYIHLLKKQAAKV